jgi:predicted amidohydrolase YtcJ
MDHRVGSLEPGKAADLTVVSEDLRRLTPDEIADMPVARTVIGGEAVFERS